MEAHESADTSNIVVVGALISYSLKHLRIPSQSFRPAFVWLLPSHAKTQYHKMQIGVSQQLSVFREYKKRCVYSEKKNLRQTNHVGRKVYSSYFRSREDLFQVDATRSRSTTDIQYAAM